MSKSKKQSETEKQRRTESIAALDKIRTCSHPAETCPRNREPSCIHALTYFEKWEPQFEVVWHEMPGDKTGAPLEGATREQIEKELEAVRGKLPVPETPASAEPPS